jgi:O-antigen/teichoic acid export membrane protein
MTPKTIAAFAIGPIGAAALGLVSLPVITWYFTQEDVGRMSMLQVTIGFAILVYSLGLDQAYVREFHESEDKPLLLKMAVLPGLVLLSITLLIILIDADMLSLWLFGIPDWCLSLIVAAAVLTSFISRFLSLVLRMNERGFSYSMSQLLPKLVLLTALGLYVLMDVHKGLTNLMLANLMAAVSVCLIYGWNTRAELVSAVHKQVDVTKLKDMLRFGMPLILGGVAFWGLTATDKIFLRSMSTFEELGLYAVAVSFAGAAIILQSVFSTIWAPTVYKWASTDSGLENVHRVSRYILAIVVLGFALTGLFSWVFTLILPVQYAGVQWIVLACMGYPLLYTLSETTVVGIGITRRSGFSMLAAVLAFIVNLIGNWLYIPKYGSAGAAVSTCFSFLVFFILRTEFAIYVWKPIKRKLLYSYTIVCVTSAIVFALYGERLGIWMNYYWCVLLVAWYLSFKNEVYESYFFIIKFCKKKVSI